MTLYSNSKRVKLLYNKIMEGMFSRDFISGLCAGVINVAFLSPLDTIRTRLMVQVNTTKDYSSFIHAVKNIKKSEGFHGFYRGSRASFVAFPLSWSIYFSIYNRIKSQRLLQEAHLSNCLSSFLAGISSTVLTNPIWLIRARMQIQTEQRGKYRGLLQSFKLITTEEGYRPFYKGICVSMLGVFHIAIQIPVYEYLKGNSDKLNWGHVLYCSAVSKFCASLITYPHEVVRARVYTKQQNVRTVVRGICANEGLKAFYGGFTPNLLRIVPSSFIVLYTYEVVSRSLHNN